LYPHSYDNNILSLKTPEDFHKPTIIKRYLFDIKRCFNEVIESNDNDVIIVSPEDFADSGEQSAKHNNYKMTNLRPGYLFDTFVEGSNNLMAASAAKAVADASGTGASVYNPLFLYGGVGLGKTHLMHAIGNQVIEQKPSIKVRYISSETFTNEFTAALREKTMPEFIKKYRDCDLILIDDIQFLEGKERTQEEMFHTFNDLYNNNKQIVIASDQPPARLGGLEERLTSRFAMGLQVDITKPDDATRAAILDKKMQRENIDIPTDVKEFILKNFINNIRDLEGALNKILAYARLSSVPISLELAENALKDQLINHAPPVLTMDYIQTIVANHYNLTTEEINSRKRTQNIVFPRQIAMYLCRKLMDVSQPEVGKFFGGRDHTTVIHSCEKISAELEYDIQLKEAISLLEKIIKGE